MIGIGFTGVNGGTVITNGVSNGVGGDSDEEMEVNQKKLEKQDFGERTLVKANGAPEQ